MVQYAPLPPPPPLLPYVSFNNIEIVQPKYAIHHAVCRAHLRLDLAFSSKEAPNTEIQRNRAANATSWTDTASCRGLQSHQPVSTVICPSVRYSLINCLHSHHPPISLPVQQYTLQAAAATTYRMVDKRCAMTMVVPRFISSRRSRAP